MEPSPHNRNSGLYSFLERLKNKPVDITVYLIVVENVQMLNIAYGHLKTDYIISGLCKFLSDIPALKSSECFRIADNQIAIITHGVENETSRQTAHIIKRSVSQYGMGASINEAAHISSVVDYIEIKTPTKGPELLDKLYVKTLSNKSLAESDEEPDQQKSLSQMAIANEIYSALDKKLLRLAYQPIIEAKSGKISHYECLLRILDKNGNTHSAGSFIHIAEKMGIIENIDIHVLDMVFDKLDADPKIHLALNISNLTIGNHLWTKRFFERARLDTAKRLIIEVTETAVMRDLSETAYFIATLQEIGCMVALDDFGSGYTSFRQIRSLSLDYVKIDGSLIKDITNNHHNQVLVKSLIEFLKGLKLKTIAEFVDGGDTAKFLIDCGIDYMQGNYFGSPQEIS